MAVDFVAVGAFATRKHGGFVIPNGLLCNENVDIRILSPLGSSSSSLRRSRGILAVDKKSRSKCSTSSGNIQN